MTETIVIAATTAEAAHVPADLPLVITGIGKTAAAAVTTRVLASRASTDGLKIVNIGTAGALRPDVIGLYVPGIVLNHDISADALRAIGHDPEERIVVGESDVVLATGDTFISDPVARDALARRADLVDMEGYAIVWAARQFGVPVTLVKHISDQADRLAAFDWPTQVELSAKVLGDWLATNVQ